MATGYGHAHQLSSLAETAALILAMGRVVSIDSAPAHLAGALGATVHILLSFSADWR